MPTNILMPALSPTMTEGKLARWLKKTGDEVKPGDVIAEIETDKATMEVEAVDEGTIGEIRVTEGTEGVAVNSIIAVMLSEGESVSDIAPPEQKPDAVPAVKPIKEMPQPLAAPKPSGVGGSTTQHIARKLGRIIASPLAKRIANDRHIDLSRVIGTGPNGRIVLADLENFHRAPQMDAPKAAAPAGPDAKKLADLLGMKYIAQANSTIRKTIAKRLTEAKQSVPHFYLTIDCDIGALMELRQQMNEAAAAKNEHVKLSVNDFVIRASALALKQVPTANASWTDSEILLYEHADISVAVATDNGLITPIIKAAEQKSVATISKEMKDLGLRARAGKLKPKEFQGGTFSISNLGMFGIRDFAAIINPPQACILAVGAGEQRAVVRNGKLDIGTIMTCTLSVDHRAVDGAVGAEYLAAFKKLIEAPSGLA